MSQSSVHATPDSHPFAPPQPQLSGDFKRDCESHAAFWRACDELRLRLPAKTARSAAEAASCAAIFAAERKAREDFLDCHVEAVYSRLTGNFSAFVRADQLVADAAEKCPGLVPAKAVLDRDNGKMQSAKDGYEIDQGIFFAHVLANERAGRHLMHAMLLPREESLERLPHFLKNGTIDLGKAALSRMGKAVVLEMRNPRFLNAMDDSTNDPVEIATDIAIIDPQSAVAVLRGGVTTVAKYAGRRVFHAGINLTLLYQGGISYLFYIRHLMGFESKFMRGVASPGYPPDETRGQTTEKPWIAAVEAFAIGGGCQHLLAMDYTLAASDAYLTLPARKEGIIPGASNMRLPRFVGDRIARQAIMYGRRLDCDSPEGRMICDEIVPSGQMDSALVNVIENLTSSGVVSAAANRRAFRVAQEPVRTFLDYVAVYAREQAYCHFSPALISNLEQHWNAQNRKV